MSKCVEVIEPRIVLDWYDGPLLEIALVVFTPVNAADTADLKLVQVEALCLIEGEHPWERATLRLSRDNLQAMLDLIDGKPVTDWHGDVISPPLVPGDRVQLGASRTVMTVNSINGDGIEVVYQYRGKSKYAVFKRHVLTKLPPCSAHSCKPSNVEREP